MPFIRTLFAAAPLVALAACASMDDAEAGAEEVAIASERSCFFTRSITGYSEAPDGPARAERLYVNTGRDERYLVEAFGPCPELDWNYRIGIDTRPFAASSLCTGDTVTLLVPGSIDGRPDRCRARVIGKVVEPS